MPPDNFLIFSKKKSVERSQNNQKVTPRGQSLPTHQRVLLFLSFSFSFGKVKQKHKPLLRSGWRMLKTSRNTRTGHLCVVWRERTESQGGLFDRKQRGGQTAVSSVLCRQSTGRFSLCFFVNSSAFFMNFARSLLYSSARSALSGCSG